VSGCGVRRFKVVKVGMLGGNCGLYEGFEKSLTFEGLLCFVV